MSAAKRRASKAAAVSTTPEKPKDPSAVEIKPRWEGDTVRATVADAMADPVVQASQSLYNFYRGTEYLSAEHLRAELAIQVAAMKSGDLDRAEAMLLAQASTLDGLFHLYVRGARESVTFEGFESKMKIGLKAQSQCRATIETLATIKNPTPPVFVRQANVANGPQQVNNGPATTSRAGEISNQQSKVLENKDDLERLEFAAPGAAGRADPPLEAVVVRNRPKDR